MLGFMERRDRDVWVKLGVYRVGGWGASFGFSMVRVMWGWCEGEGEKEEAATYQAPRHQLLGLNHNTTNYRLLTRKNEQGSYVEKIGLSGRGDTLIA